ncbi:transposase IS116/IS110/IS902 family protein, partial [Salinisphaera sp. T5B8]|uniref:transposase n=1 Tax=Salinisphaera sp. T5B8 TaxID=1304154 RepID=UPI003341D233
DDHFDQHPDLKRDKALLASIPGIGQTSARHLLCLLADRDFTSARQAAAFAGLAVVHFESGSSVRGRPHLSKQGSSKLRAVLYMAAVAALRHNRALKMFYDRLRQRGKPALSALGAVMRKLVHIAFGVFKHKTPYDPALAAQNA